VKQQILQDWLAERAGVTLSLHQAISAVASLQLILVFPLKRLRLVVKSVLSGESFGLPVV